jgi:ribosome-associated toxin RatA of RatAB toxin-antitoxin module
MFKRLEIDWRFSDARGGCELTLNINYRFASRTLEFVAVPLFDHMAAQILQAFMRRARGKIPSR